MHIKPVISAQPLGSTQPMLTMTVTPPEVVFMSPAPTLALALQCSGFLPQGPKSHGAWGLEGEGAGGR